jgi:ADP-heptose:LPS heptosyltransferase
MQVNNDCKFFRGDIPCKPHKQNGVHCADCTEYIRLTKRILIIKLGAAGDVIRTTPILRKLREIFPNAEIVWLTNYPVFVPKDYVNTILKFNLENSLWLLGREFDVLYNLDKDREALGLAAKINANIKKGYLPDEFGKCKSADNDAKDKWLTGLWDDVCMSNTKSYPQEIFEIFGYEFSCEKYIMPKPIEVPKFNLPENKKIVGLNTGCGTRWLTRLWGNQNWIILSQMLTDNGFFPLLLGGPIEDEMNRNLAKNSTAEYLGIFSREDFVSLTDKCDLVVTSVTMMMHIAIGLEKKIVLLNNIFNKHEFELYGLGEILEPEDKDCLGCYRNSCELDCMNTISPERVLEVIEKLLKR